VADIAVFPMLSISVVLPPAGAPARRQSLNSPS